MDHPKLGYLEEPITCFPHTFADPVFLISKDEGDAAGEIQAVQVPGTFLETAANKGLVLRTDRTDTTCAVCERMKPDPFIGAPAAPVSPVFTVGEPVCDGEDFTNAHGVTGSHNRRQVMGVEDILQDNGHVWLPVPDNGFETQFSFRCHLPFLKPAK
jgi:hypothetical protein